MAIIRYPNWLNDFPNVLDDFERARRQMDRLVSAFTGSGAGPIVSGVFPPLTIREDGDKMCVEAEIPGIKPEDIQISVHGKTLTLSGERKAEENDDANYHRRERKWGSFSKAITLPDQVNSEGVMAECKNGVLKIVLPRAEHAKPKKIEIKSE
ncbi:MAG: Hsp20/alpha crystallin family protein [Syntrophobacteraceae bacterium]